VDVVIDPRKMLLVTIADADGSPRDVAVVQCAYVVALDPAGTLGIAVEIVTDPGTLPPTEPYPCPSSRLKQEWLVPSRLLKVRPYVKIDLGVPVERKKEG
jgi:hypothetical protein